MPQRTYSGFAARGRTTTDAGPVDFVRGQPVDVSDEQAKALDADPDWKSTKPPKGSKPDTKES